MSGNIADYQHIQPSLLVCRHSGLCVANRSAPAHESPLVDSQSTVAHWPQYARLATSVDTKFIGATYYSSYPSEYENMLTKFDPITARYWRIYSSGSSSYLSKGLGCWDNSFFGYVGDGIVFKEPPAEGAEIKIKATVNRPYKTSDYLIDFQISTYF